MDWESCLELQARHVRRGASADDGDDGRIPFNPEGVLEHLDSAHEVELDIVERAAFALEESNAGLGGTGGVGAA